MGPRRSWLLASPLGDEVARALSHRPDALVADLVELTPESRRGEALGGVGAAIDTAAAAAGVEAFVQVHAGRLAQELKAAVRPGLSGVVVARLESRGQVEECDRLLSKLEAERGMTQGAAQIIACLDTALGNHRAMELVTASDRIWGVTLGRADLVMDLRAGPDGEFHLMPYLMQRLIIVARAAGVVPLGAWWRPPARGLAAGEEETRCAASRGRALGFKGSMCVLGPQAAQLNAGFDGG